MGLTDTCNFGPKVAVLNAQNHRRGLEPIKTSNSVANHAVYMHKATGEVWYPDRLVILVQKALFCMQKPQMKAGTHRD